MQDCQEVIIYRSPYEKNFYDMLVEYPNFFLGLIGFMILLGVGLSIYGKWSSRRRRFR